jgi:Uma2 family endonuclease
MASSATPSLSPGATPVVPKVPIWRLSVAKYHDMIRLGILGEDDAVELLEGWLVPKMPKRPAHRAATCLTRDALQGVVPSGWYVDTQEPITTTDSEPEPDVAVVRGDTRQYLGRHPGPDDLALVVEVADTSLDIDRDTKGPLYARAGILTYWIVNLQDRQVEVYTDPSGPTPTPGYGQRQDYGPGDDVPVVIDGNEVGRVPARDLLP